MVSPEIAGRRPPIAIQEITADDLCEFRKASAFFLIAESCAAVYMCSGAWQTFETLCA
jgi:hypothetical protein